jgi:hypothetical protein
MHVSGRYMQYYAASPRLLIYLAFSYGFVSFTCTVPWTGQGWDFNSMYLFSLHDFMWMHLQITIVHVLPVLAQRFVLLSEMFSKDPKPQIRGQGYPGSLSFWNFPGAKHEDRCNNGNDAACFGSGCCLSSQSSLRSSCRQGPGQFEGKASG